MADFLRNIGAILLMWYQLLGQGGNPFPTPVPARSPLPTRTPTYTFTPRPTNTPRTPTATWTQRPSLTPTSSPTARPSLTMRPFTPTIGSPTATSTRSFSATYSASPTISPTRTRTQPPSPTYTATPRPTLSLTPTRTPTPTASQTATPSSTRTWTASPTRTYTLTPRPSTTATATRTSTGTPTSTRTLTNTPSFTNSPTHTYTLTFTPTRTDTPTRTFTSTPTLTRTYTDTPTQTYTRTPTYTFSPSMTPTVTLTATVTRTPSMTFTPRPTNTVTATRTPRPTNLPDESDPLGVRAQGDPPFQKLPSAVLIYPLVRASATTDTRIEMMNLTGAPISVQCFYVTARDCNETGFFISLTGNQPLSWFASNGMTGNGTRVAPPFVNDGELKCFVRPSSPDLASHNALQGRALVSDITNTPNAEQVIGYSAIAFRRLSPGTFTGSVSLDGVTYEACPDRLHFNALAQTSTSDSELILVPCTQDLVNQVASRTTIQYAVINELEQHFSASTTLQCMDRRRFSTIPAIRKSSIGTDTAHLIVRAIDVPVVGFVIDRFVVPGGALSTSSNDPYLEGSREATLSIPTD